MIIHRLFSRLLRRRFRRPKTGAFPDAKVGNFNIAVSKGHPLSSYLETFPLYDQFIPAICRFLKGRVIDIGANVGDTMAAILSSNQDLEVLCVEPDPHFYSILEHNRKSIDLHSRITTLQAFVSNKTTSFTIEKNTTQSTGNVHVAALGKQCAPTISIAELLRNIDPSSVSLIKTDTDGYDSDILQSIADYVESAPTFTPILFFEMQTYLQNVGFSDPTRLKRQHDYFDAVRRMQQLGYDLVAIIDNFGTPMFKHTSLEMLSTMENYIAASQLQNKYPTIYYMDIVLYKECHRSVVENAWSELLGIK